MASIFAELYADLDVPSSDFAAGFVLLSKYQAAQREWIIKNQQFNVTEQFLSSMPITSQTKFLDLTSANDSHLVNELIYYMNYSLAIFGWPLQVVDAPCTCFCIFPYLRVSSCCRRGSRRRRLPAATKKETEKGTDDNGKTVKGEAVQSEGHGVEVNAKKEDYDGRGEVEARKESIVGQLDDDCDMPIVLDDNCCGLNMASAEQRLRAHNFEIIYVSYKSNVHVVPFLVAADHSKQTIVVAIRGSMSMSDMVTDLNGQTDKLPIDDCPDDWLCHRGMTRASEYVKRSLLEEHILDRAFNCRPDLGSKDYTLVLCGHSLGAGVAAILGILLRSRYPTLKSYLYSPPGGILSLPAVEYTKQFAIGTLLGNDVVPRLGIAQLERLRYHVLLSSKSSNKSASKILTRALCPSFCCGSNKVEYDPSQSLDLLHGTSGRPFDYNGSKVPFQVQPHLLYVPGRLIHVVKNYSFKTKARRIFNEPIYQAIWTENTDYDRIMIGEGMFYDHLPKNLMHAMKMLFSNTLPGKKDSESSSSVQPEAHSTNPILSTRPREHSGGPETETTAAIVNHLAEKLKENSISVKDDNNNVDCENKNDSDSCCASVASEPRTHHKTDEVSVQLDQKTQPGAKILDNNGNDDSLLDRNTKWQ